MSSNPQYLFPDYPELGEPRQVAPGVFWLRMHLPFKLNHINLWVLEDGDGWTVVDTGFGHNNTEAVWERVLSGELSGRPIKRVIVTHFHPDHMGLAGWFELTHDASMWATLGEFAMGRMLSLDFTSSETSRRVFHRFYRQAGCDEAMMTMVAERGNPYPARVQPLPGSFIRIRDGDRIPINGRDWQVMVGFGHSPEHACLYSPDLNVLISGDQILPRISPNISVWPQEPEANPLALFLASLETFRPLPADTLVLPSHDGPFRGLHERIDQLAHHHDQRLAETVQACSESLTAAQVLKVLFRRELDDHQIFFAIGETLAHLRYLEGEGGIERRSDQQSADFYQRCD